MPEAPGLFEKTPVEKELDQAHDEIARLREALERITYMYPGPNTKEAIDIAVRALAPRPPGKNK